MFNDSDTDDRLASIILLSYNSKDDLAECIPSLENQTYPNHEIIIVDNASTDNTPEFVRTDYPHIRFVETGSNRGYPAGNNIGFQHASGEYIVILNPDTVADPNWLAELIRPFKENPDIGLTTSKILMYDQQEKINTCGNSIHYTGLDFCRGLYEPSSSYSKPEEVGAISGCSFAIRREVFEQLGGFDLDFFLYLDDADLSWRARLMGHRILFVPKSVVYHKYKLSIAPWKEFYLERNRYLMLMKNCSSRMLVLMLPAILVTEIVTWGHAVLNDYQYVQNKLRAYWWVLTNPSKILNKRREVQNKRKIADREIIRLFDMKIPFEQVIGSRIFCWMGNVIFNTFYGIYFKLLYVGLFNLKGNKYNRFGTLDKNES